MGSSGQYVGCGPPAVVSVLNRQVLPYRIAAALPAPVVVTTVDCAIALIETIAAITSSVERCFMAPYAARREPVPLGTRREVFAVGS